MWASISSRKSAAQQNDQGGGAIAHKLVKGNRQAVKRLSAAISFGIASLALFLLSILD